MTDDLLNQARIQKYKPGPIPKQICKDLRFPESSLDMKLHVYCSFEHISLAAVQQNYLV